MREKNFSIEKIVFNEENQCNEIKIIDYKITKFDGDRGFQLATKCIKVFVPLLMPVLSSFKDLAGKDQSEIENEALQSIDANFFNSLGTAITQNFDDKQVYSLIKELMECVVIVEGSRELRLHQHFANHFKGWYDSIIPLTLEVIKHNGFFGLIAKAINLTKTSV